MLSCRAALAADAIRRLADEIVEFEFEIEELAVRRIGSPVCRSTVMAIRAKRVVERGDC